jgi:hypothetical protein
MGDVNAVMNRRVPVIYVGAIAAGLFLSGLSLRTREWTVLVTAAVALLCLFLDLVFMVRENVRINGVTDRWSTTSYPEDWEHYRTQWFAVFRSRQVLLLVGFSSVLAGAVFR